jgi:hypothetical protein
MKTKIRSVMVITNNFFKEYRVGDTVNGIVIDEIERFGDEVDGESFCGWNISGKQKSLIFDLIRVPFIVHYEKNEPVKNPCSSCGKEWDHTKTDECSHCGNVCPF